MTEWKRIPDVDTKMMYYEASNDMQIRSVNKIIGETRIRLQTKNSGYMIIAIKKTSICVHSLIASAWIKKPPDYDDTFTVDHIDNNPLNNSIDNLQWLSKQDQLLKRRKNDRTQINAMPVYGKNIETGIETYYESMIDAAEKIEGNISCISMCINKKAKKHKGYTWRPPETLPDLSGEEWTFRNKNTKYTIYYSKHRIAFEYKCGYIKKLYSQDLVTERGITERDAYPTICINGKDKYLHRDIWETFNGQIPNGMEINHIDHNKQNCALNNLELVTSSDNQFAAYNAGRYNETKTARRPVIINDKEYISVTKAAEKLGVSRKTITNHINDFNYPTYKYL